MKFLIVILTVLLFTACDKSNNLLNNPNEFTDSRDGEVYRTVTINGVRWMAQNLRYVDILPNGDTANYPVNHPPYYGNYYKTSRMQEVCPNGWHLPSDEEWTDLEEYVLGRKYVNSDITPFAKGTLRGDIANKLKSNDTDWGGEGTDDYGLDIKAAGAGTPHNLLPIIGSQVLYMTSTLANNSEYYYRGFRIGQEGIERVQYTAGVGNISVSYAVCRCIED